MPMCGCHGQSSTVRGQGRRAAGVMRSATRRRERRGLQLSVLADALISRIEPLDNAAAAFAALGEGGNVMKVLVDCQGTAG
jgi:hypothetical protein